jgi:acetylornithine aminotransferase
MEEDGLLDNAAKMGTLIQTRLVTALMGKKGVKEVRGHGLMIGIELDKPCGVITQRAADAGLLLSVTADSVIRLVPPLIITGAEADEIVARLLPIIETFLAENA